MRSAFFAPQISHLCSSHYFPWTSWYHPETAGTCLCYWCDRKLYLSAIVRQTRKTITASQKRNWIASCVIPSRFQKESRPINTYWTLIRPGIRPGNFISLIPHNNPMVVSFNSFQKRGKRIGFSSISKDKWLTCGKMAPNIGLILKSSIKSVLDYRVHFSTCHTHIH